MSMVTGKAMSMVTGKPWTWWLARHEHGDWQVMSMVTGKSWACTQRADLTCAMTIPYWTLSDAGRTHSISTERWPTLAVLQNYRPAWLDMDRKVCPTATTSSLHFFAAPQRKADRRWPYSQHLNGTLADAGHTYSTSTERSRFTEHNMCITKKCGKFIASRKPKTIYCFV